MIRKVLPALFALLFAYCVSAFGADDRAQYPAFLSNSYFSIAAGYINVPFTEKLLRTGFRTDGVQLHHFGLRITLGHRFNKYFSAQLAYMKPLSQAVFQNLNANGGNHSVWIHLGGLTIRSNLLRLRNLDFYAEGGLGLITRRGFQINGAPAVENASYGSFLAGGGLQYHWNSNWDLTAGAVYSPARQQLAQPSTAFFFGGFTYNMRPLSAERVKEISESPFVFPHNLLQVGYTTNTLGYGINNFVSKKPFDIFWGGEAEVSDGIWTRYQRNLFHTRKLFAFDCGTSFGYWTSRIDGGHFVTLSAFPSVRFFLIRSKPIDFYFTYSVAGPSYISKTNIDGLNTGKHFTFQDFMGVGGFLGRSRNVNLEISIDHYSNGNIFADNAAVKVPLNFSFGYTF